MKEISLTQGKVALVDDQMYEIINQYRWYFHIGRCDVGYATRMMTCAPKKRIQVRMHHVVIGYPLNRNVVDHINGDSLDNQISNLRITTQRVNCVNGKKIKVSPRLLGAHFMGGHRRIKKWNSRINIGGKTKSLGMFLTEKEAADAYQNKLIEIREAPLSKK